MTHLTRPEAAARFRISVRTLDEMTARWLTPDAGDHK